MAELLLLGEDKTHALLLGTLALGVLKEIAPAKGLTWVIDNLDTQLLFRGEEDLSSLAPGLRYTSTLQSFEPRGPGGKPLKRLGRAPDGQAAGPETAPQQGTAPRRPGKTTGAGRNKYLRDLFSGVP